MIVRIQRDKEYFQLCIEEDCIILLPTLLVMAYAMYLSDGLIVV